MEVIIHIQLHFLVLFPKIYFPFAFTLLQFLCSTKVHCTSIPYRHNLVTFWLQSILSARRGVPAASISSVVQTKSLLVLVTATFTAVHGQDYGGTLSATTETIIKRLYIKILYFCEWCFVLYHVHCNRKQLHSYDNKTVSSLFQVSQIVLIKTRPR